VAHTSAIVVAGGRGERFGAPKQFAVLGPVGRPRRLGLLRRRTSTPPTAATGARLVDHAVAAAAAACDEVVVVMPDGRAWDGAPVAATVPGGATRSASVRAGLAAVSSDVEIVVVHDAARPLASPALFELVVDAVRGGADAAIPALEVADTLKRVDGPRVAETVPRDGLVAAQTPQAFRVEALRQAHARGGDATDDAALVEATGGTVVVVPGDPRNLKITTVADLALATTLLEAT
jgi:2-C-methyl-D-erythritol 4-phosphate cytidylyltransferase